MYHHSDKFYSSRLFHLDQAPKISNKTFKSWVSLLTIIIWDVWPFDSYGYFRLMNNKTKLNKGEVIKEIKQRRFERRTSTEVTPFPF